MAATSNSYFDAEDCWETVALFKLGFGGRIVLSPGAYDYLANPLLRWGYTTVIPRIATWPIVSKLEYLLRGI